MTTPRQRAPHATGTWTPSPSPSPPPSPPLTLTDAERLLLLSTHGPLKPSSLPAPNASPLLFLNPTELEELAEREKVEWEEEGEVLLWEELANDLLWTVPFGFLYSGMDYAVHAQFGVPLVASAEFSRLLNVMPCLYLLTFLTSRPKPLLRPLLLQSLLFILCLSSGIALIHITTTESYLQVMRQAPGLGVLWVWSVVRLDLAWAVAGLVGVAAAVWMRGEAGGVVWW